MPLDARCRSSGVIMDTEISFIFEAMTAISNKLDEQNQTKFFEVRDPQQLRSSRCCAAHNRNAVVVQHTTTTAGLWQPRSLNSKRESRQPKL